MKDPDPELAKGKGTEGESKDPENISVLKCRFREFSQDILPLNMSSRSATVRAKDLLCYSFPARSA